jgi:hypothetical protein
MHKKYAKDGFAAVSVALDDPTDKKIQARILTFLQKHEAGFTNLVLDEKDEFWQDKLKFYGPPLVFVFNREGKYKRYSNPDYAEIEKTVIEFLKK